MTIYIQFT